MGRNWKRTIRIRERQLTERIGFLVLKSRARRVLMPICNAGHLPDVRLTVRVVLRIWSRNRFIRHERQLHSGQ
jgi:hypothetical protein